MIDADKKKSAPLWELRSQVVPRKSPRIENVASAALRRTLGCAGCSRACQPPQSDHRHHHHHHDDHRHHHHDHLHCDAQLTW